MEFAVNMNDIDDARDMFLLAKDRLLGICDWNNLLHTKGNRIVLTDTRGAKVHRNARVGDLVKVSVAEIQDDTPDVCARVSAIQYDFFPDIRNESISLLLETGDALPGKGLSNAQQRMETIIITRKKNTITAECYAGNRLPQPNDEAPDQLLHKPMGLHPLLNLPQNSVNELLQGFIAVYEQR